MAPIVAVAGNLAAGKSTLAKALCRANGWLHYPEGNYDTSYLDDLFAAPGRWAFEAQMAFLHHKAEAVRQAMASPTTVVLDRSLSEDVHVFASYFHRRGWMDDRAYALYMRYAEPLLDRLPAPDVVLYCDAPVAECRRRLAARPRSYQRLFPEGHLERLYDLYEQWWAQVPKEWARRIDTTALDVRSEEDCAPLAKEVAHLLDERERSPGRS